MATHLVSWRVSHAKLVHNVALVLRHTLLTQGFIAGHAEHIDGLFMFSANCILLCHLTDV